MSTPEQIIITRLPVIFINYFWGGFTSIIWGWPHRCWFMDKLLAIVAEMLRMAQNYRFPNINGPASLRYSETWIILNNHWLVAVTRNSCTLLYIRLHRCGVYPPWIDHFPHGFPHGLGPHHLQWLHMVFVHLAASQMVGLEMSVEQIGNIWNDPLVICYSLLLNIWPIYIWFIYWFTY
jgi:hypothetical protein